MMNILLQADSSMALSNWSIGSNNLYGDLLIIALIVVMLTLLAAALVVHRAINAILKLTLPELLAEDKARKVARQGSWKRRWDKMLGLRPIDEEKDITIDHEYDGIQELDNPVPIWFNTLFYGTIVFGLIYLFVFQISGWGLNQDQEYEREMALAEVAKQEYLAQAANLIDESSVTVDETGTMAAAGKTIFLANCAACHGNAGEGTIGPNLTDKFWVHGGEIVDIFKTVKYGVPDKGMVPWEQTLTPAQIAEVSNYIITLRNTNPANPKEPQGIEVEYSTGVAAVDTVSTL